jgi:anti-sigma regulatory factor (Ser/Thr protein kinase)
MNHKNGFSQEFAITGRDFSNAGSISTKIKEILQEIGIDPAIIRRAAIAAYEAEMNVVMYSNQGIFTLHLTPYKVHFKVEDKGPGIENIDLAMQEGFSTATEEMREMGFGAGMGLPNIKKNADKFGIASIPGKGTTLEITFNLNQEK